MYALALTMLLGAAGPAQDAEVPDLSFRSGTLDGWETQGNAFYVTAARGDADKGRAVCSSDRGSIGRTGLLRKEFTVPAGARAIRFRAYAAWAGAAADWRGDARLDVLLAAAGKRIIPKSVKTARGWEKAPRVLPREDGPPREYRWDVAGLAGRRVQIVIGDDEKRPGCFLYCSGFEVVLAEEPADRKFAREMAALARKNDLAPAVRYDSRHFTALSNADDRFTRDRLTNCELIYSLFFEHFRARGFRLGEPAGKLMVAVFDSQSGFEAYLGQKMPAGVTGLYHPRTNRLLVYDYGSNEAFVAQKEWALRRGRGIGWQDARNRYTDTIERVAREFRTGTNVATTMHEVAHQLSFNTGMLNREGDVPFWLAEGLACYCEATDGGAWQGLGEPNPARLATLADALRGRGRLFRLEDMVASDKWRQSLRDSTGILIGYAESWALFKFLMEERPRAMRKYLSLIYDRKAPEHRLTDFRQAFGADVGRLEVRFLRSIKQMVQDHRPTPR